MFQPGERTSLFILAKGALALGMLYLDNATVIALPRILVPIYNKLLL
jgi:hypothetical protein